MNFFNEFLNYTRLNYKKIGFTCLFYSSVFVLFFTRLYSFQLSSFQGRMIGNATLNGISISRVVSMFYLSAALFLLCLISITLLFFCTSRFGKTILSKRDFYFLNASSAAGVFLIMFRAMGTINSTCIILLVFIQLIFLMAFFARKYFSDTHQKHLSVAVLTILLCLGFALFFFLRELFALLNITLIINLYLFLFLFLIIAIWCIEKSFKNKIYPSSLNGLSGLLSIIAPLVLLPALGPLRDEIYIALNNREIYFLSPGNIYTMLVFILLIWVFFKSQKKANALSRPTPFYLLSNLYFPLFVAGLSTYLHYNPVLLGTDIFEDANRILPVMEWHKFGTIPIIEKFNSHILSDIFSPFVYALLNGFEKPIFLTYDFLIPVFAAILTYYIILRFTNNPYVAIFIVFFFPGPENLIPSYFSIILLLIFIIQKTIKKKTSAGSYFLFLTGLAFFIVWRIDLGTSAIAACLILLIYATLNGKIKINFFNLLKATGIFSILLIGTGAGFYFFKGIDFSQKIPDFLSYLSSYQSYGRINQGDPSLNVFRMQYFVFPLLALSFLAYLFVNYSRSFLNRKTRFSFTAIIFLLGFYLFNFQRGIVRHGFAENTDVFLSSFIFLIISVSVYFIAERKSHLFKFNLFIGFAFFLIWGFKFPEKRLLTPFEELKEKIDLAPVSPENLIKKKEQASFEYEDEYKGFKDFISENLKPGESFLDFSNSPMLFYFTKRVTPSEFYQNPVSLHNDRLQKRFLRDLPMYKLPLAVFSKSYPEFWDNVDSIPNAVRHYRVAEYLYREYAPFVIVHGYYIWKKKDAKLKAKDSIPESYSEAYKIFDLKLLPYIWSNYDARIDSASPQAILHLQHDTLINSPVIIEIPGMIDKSSGNYIRLIIKSGNPVPIDISMKYGNAENRGEYHFRLPPGSGKRTLAVRMSMQYNWYSQRNDRITIQAFSKTPVLVSEISLLKGD